MANDAVSSDDTAPDERALTTRKVGEILGVAVITLSKWRVRGLGPRWFHAGRNVRYRLGDVIAWRDARTVGRREP